MLRIEKGSKMILKNRHLNRFFNYDLITPLFHNLEIGFYAIKWIFASI
jgi:hypothetical protein